MALNALVIGEVKNISAEELASTRKRASANAYGFDKLEVGQGFTIKGRSMAAVRSAMHYFMKLNDDYKLVARKLGDEILAVRVAE